MYPATRSGYSIYPLARYRSGDPDMDWLPPASEVMLFRSAVLPERNYTSAAVVVQCGDRLAAVRVSGRGWDLPGGHRERLEKPEDTIRREAQEEAGLDLSESDVEPLGFLQIYTGPTSPNYRYRHNPNNILFYKARVAEARPLEPMAEFLHECEQAEWMNTADFLAKVSHRLWSPLLRTLLSKDTELLSNFNSVERSRT